MRKWILAAGLLALLAYSVSLFKAALVVLGLLSVWITTTKWSVSQSDTLSPNRISLGSVFFWMAIGCAGLAILRYFHTGYSVEARVTLGLTKVFNSLARPDEFLQELNKRLNIDANRLVEGEGYPVVGREGLKCHQAWRHNSVVYRTSCKPSNIDERMEQLMQEIDDLRSRNSDLEFRVVRIEHTTRSPFSRRATTEILEGSSDPELSLTEWS